MIPVELRSDTMTRPTAAMRRAISEAEVGDDVWGEDPTVKRLQTKVAELLGKEAALFVPSGTMANQIALLCHTQRGDEVLLGWGSHCTSYEAGAAGAFAGIQTQELGRAGLLTAEELAAALRPPNGHQAHQRLVWLENSHNRGGGRVYAPAAVRAIAGVARAAGLALHLDGARLLNAATACDCSPAELVAAVDSTSICLSKGLGAPAGSVLAGTRAFIERARRARTMFGGGLRQAGILAAAGLHALDHHVRRLVEDHDNARLLASGLAGLPGLRLDPTAVETNIVIFDLEPPAPDAETLVARARAAGVLVAAVGPRRVRAVTHLDVNRAQCEHAISVLDHALRP
ncbi:MAG: low-specificity L-threonine aldolase [Deltaproteobacteria bacterium]|nr:low-specificity L-threonine aldolase [Deltaproteobacteria bacterium]